jgi:torulene dioxygenase
MDRKYTDLLIVIFLKIGSGTYNILLDNGDTYHVSHPFDSLAMVHRFEICGSKQTIYYNSRHTSNGVEKRITDNDPTLVTFGPDICKSIFGRMQTVFHHLVNLKPNTIRRENEPELEVINTTITPNFPIGEQLENELNIKRGEALVAKHDVNFLQVIDPKSLSTIIFSI